MKAEMRQVPRSDQYAMRYVGTTGVHSQNIRSYSYGEKCINENDSVAFDYSCSNFMFNLEVTNSNKREHFQLMPSKIEIQDSSQILHFEHYVPFAK